MEKQQLRNVADDPDGDGMDNQSEMAAGTDPTDASSCLRMLSFNVSGSELSGNIQTTAGRYYYVESLLPGDTIWRPITDIIGGQNSATPWHAARPAMTKTGFYRAILIVPSEMTLATP